MPKVFISYRRDDSWQAAQLVRERLARWFSRDAVFMDVSGIEGGAVWRARLQEELEAADAVVVVIGRQWLGCADDRGRRLDRPDDVVRWEIEAALARGKRVVPLLVDGAQPPPKAALPEPLQPLAELQALHLSNTRFEKDIETLIETIGGQGRIIDLFAETRRILRLLKSALFFVPLVSLAIFFAAWVSLFDLLGIDSLASNVTMLAGDAIAPPGFSEQLVLVGADQDARRIADGSARADDAALIEALSRLGAKRIVFDAFYRRATPFDATLLEAIRSARRRGTEVILGFNDVTDGKPAAFPGLLETASALGNVCVARRLGVATSGFLGAQRNGSLLPGLPLLAASGPVIIDRLRTDAAELDLRDAAGRARSERYSTLERVRAGRSRCPALAENDVGAAVLFPLSAKEELRRRQKSADDILRRPQAPDAEFQGRIVLVGLRDPQDMLVTRLDGRSARYGYEFHADTISALLRSDIVSVMPGWAQWLLMVFVAGAALALRLARGNLMHRWRVWIAAAIAALCVLCAVFAYIEWRLLLNPVYQVVAFAFAYVIFGLCERKATHADT